MLEVFMKFKKSSRRVQSEELMLVSYDFIEQLISRQFANATSLNKKLKNKQKKRMQKK